MKIPNMNQQCYVGDINNDNVGIWILPPFIFFFSSNKVTSLGRVVLPPSFMMGMMFSWSRRNPRLSESIYAPHAATLPDGQQNGLQALERPPRWSGLGGARARSPTLQPRLSRRFVLIGSVSRASSIPFEGPSRAVKVGQCSRPHSFIYAGVHVKKWHWARVIWLCFGTKWIRRTSDDRQADGPKNLPYWKGPCSPQYALTWYQCQYLVEE